jgi:quinol monooxygenase YgiN
VRYGYLGTMRTKPGRRAEVVRILLGGQDGLRAAGCELYLVGTSEQDPDLVWVQEVWLSKAHHDASLELPETKAAISAAMPSLTGEFTGQEIDVVGGLGLAAEG